jgi:hypothetical protein
MPKVRACAPALRIENQIQVMRYLGSDFPKDIAKLALDTVTNHRSSDFTGNGDPQPVVNKVVRATEQDKVLGVYLSTGIVNGAVFRSLDDPVFPGELLTSWLNHSRSTFCVPLHAGASAPGGRQGWTSWP